MQHLGLQLDKDARSECENFVAGTDGEQIATPDFTVIKICPNATINVRFWRNIHSECGIFSEIEYERLFVHCVDGSIRLNCDTLENPVNGDPLEDKLLTGGNEQNNISSLEWETGDPSITYPIISADPRQGDVSDSLFGHQLSITAGGAGARIVLKANIQWSTNTDHDLYGLITCEGSSSSSSSSSSDSSSSSSSDSSSSSSGASSSSSSGASSSSSSGASSSSSSSITESIDPCLIESPLSVYYGRKTYNGLTLDQDVLPECEAGNNDSAGETITGTFTTLNNQIKFRFWRNIYSECNSDKSSDLTDNKITVTCNSGSITIQYEDQIVIKNAGESLILNDKIEFVNQSGSISNYNNGYKLTIFNNDNNFPPESCSFTVEAHINWDTVYANEVIGRDHDLYGIVYCDYFESSSSTSV
jgi:hypothetical protein